MHFLGNNTNYWFFSTKGQTKHWSVNFRKGDTLVFGPETRGLPKKLIEENYAQTLSIPMLGKYVRSLNLSTSVGIATYEALRQIQL